MNNPPQIDEIARIDIKVFARNMRRYRAKRRMTQKELADSSGVDLATINQMENIGVSVNRDPRVSSLSAVANALGVTLAEMFQGTAEEPGELSSYLTLSEWFWDKFRRGQRIEGATVPVEVSLLRRAFEGFLAFVKPDREFTEREKELIWNDRPNIYRQDNQPDEMKDKKEKTETQSKESITTL